MLPSGYNGPRAPDRQIVRATPRNVALVGYYHWTTKQINLSAFSNRPVPSCKTLVLDLNTSVGLDIIGEGPESFRKAWEARVKEPRSMGSSRISPRKCIGRRRVRALWIEMTFGVLRPGALV